MTATALAGPGWLWRVARQRSGSVPSAGSAGRVEAVRDQPPLDRDAFESFYQATAGGLRRYLRRVCQPADLAEDVLQESFVRFLVRPSRGCELPAMRSYLYRIATNLVRDQWRRRQRERAAGEELLTRRRLPAADPGPHQGEEALAAAFAALPPRDRAVLWLAHVEGYSHREIADMTGLRAGGVKVKLFRLRRRLAARLGTESRGTES